MVYDFITVYVTKLSLFAGPRLRRRDSSHSRASSSSSSGCMSDGGAPSSCCEVAFECDFHTTGTIKRKPSMNPKLPLTSITRQLKEVTNKITCVTKLSFWSYCILCCPQTEHYWFLKKRFDTYNFYMPSSDPITFL